MGSKTVFYQLNISHIVLVSLNIVTDLVKNRDYLSLDVQAYRIILIGGAMRVTTEIIRDRVGNIPAFDVRIELFKDTGSIRLLRLSITSCQRDNEIIRFSKAVFDYGKFVFIKTCWSGEQVVDLFDHMQKGQSFEIEGFTSVFWEVKASGIEFDTYRVFSGQWFSLPKRKYPYDLYTSTIDIDNSPEFEASQPLNSNGVPYFPTLQDAEAYFLFDTFLQEMNQSRKQIHVIIDDQRARFKRIIVTKLGLRISLEGNELSSCELKLFGKRPGLTNVRPVSETNEVEIPLEALPMELSVLLSIGNESVDKRYISDKPSFYAPTEGITIEKDEQTSIDGILMLRGENQYIDFKQEYTDKILSTVCAFANAEGGSVFVGITDEGEILGLQEKWDDLRLRVENAISDRMLGHVKVNYIPFTYMISTDESKIVLEIKVEEANDKPIALRDGKKEKYYLRRDGTNRIIKRDDWAYLIRKEREVT
ncbi:AlbA family DNA-binding domain-containing protein [Desulfosporosinus lacus]|uniref:Putative DNA-binding domain-containing protein n=1 Tax=Desulfosporosinus lacus DSM 15449 TaxID=1121420 RepID=A0A1M6DLC9_9FIRM|nr:ATP-binding protein [Desulfosporosinus lacus]SHI74002.1 Putative DNA-binding domain-containing protein [Desulfosporosinus lacus DSM 15449]